MRLSPKHTSFPVDRREEGEHLSDGKLPLGKNIQHFAADIAGGPDDCDLAHGQLLNSFRRGRKTPRPALPAKRMGNTGAK